MLMILVKVSSYELRGVDLNVVIYNSICNICSFFVQFFVSNNYRPTYRPYCIFVLSNVHIIIVFFLYHWMRFHNNIISIWSEIWYGSTNHDAF